MRWQPRASMGALSHWLIVLSYAVVATAVGASLATYLYPVEAILCGGMAFLGGALLHNVYARRQREGELMALVRALRGSYGEMQGDFERVRGEVRALREALPEDGGFGAKQQEVLGELKVLHHLIQQMWAGRQGKPAAPAASVATPAPAPASPPAPVKAEPLGPGDGEILDIVREGLASGRVDLFLQPIVTLPQRRRRFYECYSRIRAEDGAQILPDRYLAVAAREGLITAIDNMLLFRCMQLIRKVRPKNPEVGFFCNIAGHSLADKGFLQDLVDFIGQHGDMAQGLVFEFAEADLGFIDDQVRRHMDALADKGIRFSVDNVTRLPFDAAELARNNISFVKVEASRIGDPRGGSPSALRRALERHGIALIVEKLESEKDLIELLDHDIPYGQGYLFGEPRLSQAA